MTLKRTVLVTGGAGFIGSNLCKELIKRKSDRVISLDDYSTGSKKNHVDGVTYIEGNTKDISNLMQFSVDVVFHLGEYSRVEQSFEDFDAVWDSNMRGTLAVVKFCHATSAKLIYAGSSTKFGDGGLGSAQSPYGWTKSKNTEFVKNFSEWFGLKYAITYFYNAYGPNEISQGRFATVIGLYSQLMKNGEPLPVVMPGTQERNFTHVSDIVSGLLVVADSGEGDGFGIGNQKSYSIIDVASLFGGEITFLPKREGNRMCADLVTENTAKLGWKCKFELENYVADLKKRYKS